MEKKGVAGKGLRTTIKEGIAITTLTEKNFVHSLHLKGWVG
jgi:hypothetical protein